MRALPVFLLSLGLGLQADTPLWSLQAGAVLPSVPLQESVGSVIVPSVGLTFTQQLDSMFFLRWQANYFQFDSGTKHPRFSLAEPTLEQETHSRLRELDLGLDLQFQHPDLRRSGVKFFAGGGFSLGGAKFNYRNPTRDWSGNLALTSSREQSAAVSLYGQYGIGWQLHRHLEVDLLMHHSYFTVYHWDDRKGELADYKGIRTLQIRVHYLF